MNWKKNILLLFVIFNLLITPFSAFALDERCDFPDEVFVEGAGCFSPKIKVDTKVYLEKEGSPIASSSSILGGDQIDAIKITNPFAAQGQPVIVKFTLENIGDQFGYPYNQIDLPPDNYVLMLGVDKDIGIRDKENRLVDIWGLMSTWERFAYIMVTSSVEFATMVRSELKGEVCGYVDLSKASQLGIKAVPQRILDIVKERTGSERIMVWSCLKITDKPFFATELKAYCNKNIDSSCMSKISNDFGNSVSDTIQVLLSSSDEGEILKGECVRPHSGKGLWGYLKKLALPMIDWNIVKCSLGDDGLKPGEKVTFDFVVLVPRDAPVVNPRNIDELKFFGDRTEEEAVYTFDTVCRDDNPNVKACHSIYAGVYPARTKNWLNVIGKGFTNSLKLGSCTISGIFTSAKISTCSQGKGFDINAVGEPIWEGSGIFYIVGPVLKATIEMVLWAAALAGGLLGFGLGGPGKK